MEPSIARRCEESEVKRALPLDGPPSRLPLGLIVLKISPPWQLAVMPLPKCLTTAAHPGKWGGLTGRRAPPNVLYWAPQLLRLALFP